MDERVRRAISILESTGFRSTSVGRLADAVGLSCSRLQHLFKRETGRSIRAYVKGRRLELAAALMLKSNRRVSEILYEVGFTDFSNFNHAFKRTFGVSPRNYRRRG
ncbi:MAG: helix-turn-helix transcriptional regulator [Thermoanaerobaculia bacterium]